MHQPPVTEEMRHECLRLEHAALDAFRLPRDDADYGWDAMRYEIRYARVSGHWHAVNVPLAMRVTRRRFDDARAAAHAELWELHVEDRGKPRLAGRVAPLTRTGILRRWLAGRARELVELPA